MTALRILVAGYGYVGQRLVEVLQNDGHSISIVRRQKCVVPPGISAHFVDLNSATSVKTLPRDFDLCFYLVAPNSATIEAYRSAYIDCLENVASHLSSNGSSQTRIVMASSTSVYHQCDGSWVDEDSPTEPHKFQGRILLEAEAALRASTTKFHIVRFSGIYGPERLRIISQLRQGIAPKMNPHAYSNRIHLDDCAGILRFITTSDDFPTLVNGSDDEPTEWSSIYDWLVDRLGINPLSLDQQHEMRSENNKRISNQLLRKSGYRLKFPSFREGFAPHLNLDK